MADLRSTDDGNNSARRLARSELFTTVHELSRLISVFFDNAIRPQGLTHSQWWAMMHISERPGATQIELAAYMGMGRAAAGKLFERLEAKNWIERRQDANDARVRRIYLSEQATPILNAMQKEGEKLFEVFLKDVSHDEEIAALNVLRKIRVNAGGM